MALDHPVVDGDILGLTLMMGMVTFPVMVSIQKILQVGKVYQEKNMDKRFLIMIPNSIKRLVFHMLL